MINVQNLLGLPDSHAEPAPLVQADDDAGGGQGGRGRPRATRPGARVLLPRQRGEVRSHRSEPWLKRHRRVQGQVPGHARSATTEPVADYMLDGQGADNLTPFTFQADIMNGADPSPQDVALEDRLLHRAPGEGVPLQPAGDRLAHRVVPRDRAHANGIPVVGVYETMPTPGYDYQTWMLAEVSALEKAVARQARRPSSCDGPHSVTERPQDRRSSWMASASGSAAARSSTTSRFAVAAGEFTGLIGSNGAGKTTLLRVDPRPAGADRRPGRVDGRPRPRRPARSATCRRRSLLDPDMPLRARDLVGLGLDGHRLGLPLPSRDRRRAVEEMLEAVDASRFADARVGDAVRRRAAAGPDRPRADQPAAAAAARRAARQPRHAQRQEVVALLARIAPRAAASRC